MNKILAVDRSAQTAARRAASQPDVGDTAEGAWAQGVATLLGPRLVGEGIERQRIEALHLAAAALDAAGETVLANEVRERIEDAA